MEQKVCFLSSRCDAVCEYGTISNLVDPLDVVGMRYRSRARDPIIGGVLVGFVGGTWRTKHPNTQTKHEEPPVAVSASTKSYIHS